MGLSGGEIISEDIKRTISKIGNEEREQLFQTFVEKGGKVVQKTTLKQALEKRNHNRTPVHSHTSSGAKKEDDGSQKGLGGFSKSKDAREIIEDFQKKDIVRKTVLGTGAKQSQDALALEGLRLFFKRFSVFFGGVTDFSGKEISATFCQETYFVIKDVFASLKGVTSYLIQSPLFKRLDLIQSFSGSYPIFTEMILRIHSLKLEQIAEKFQHPRKMSIAEAKPSYLLIIRNLFPFWGRGSLVTSSFEQSFKVLRQLKATSLSNLAVQEKSAYDAIRRIFVTYLDKLEKLYPLLIQKDVAVISRASQSILELKSTDFLGSWGSTIQKMFQKQQEEQEEEESSEFQQEELQNEEVQVELNELYKLRLSAATISPDLITYPKNDKIFLLASILDHCIDRFWVLNNGKYIAYRPMQDGGQKFSIEMIIRDFFLNCEKYRVSIKNYTQILSNLNSFTKDLSTDSNTDPLYVMSKDEENIREMRKKLSRQLRGQARDFISAVVLPMSSRIEGIAKYLRDPDMNIHVQENFSKTPVNGTPLKILRGFYHFLEMCRYLLDIGELSGMGSVVSSNSPLVNLYGGRTNDGSEETGDAKEGKNISL